MQLKKKSLANMENRLTATWPQFACDESGQKRRDGKILKSINALPGNEKREKKKNHYELKFCKKEAAEVNVGHRLALERTHNV